MCIRDSPLGLWAKWNPQRGDKVRLVDGDFDSGILYVDDPRTSGGFFRLEAVSVPPVSYTHLDVYKRQALCLSMYSLARLLCPTKIKEVYLYGNRSF